MHSERKKFYFAPNIFNTYLLIVIISDKCITIEFKNVKYVKIRALKYELLKHIILIYTFISLQRVHQRFND